MATDWQALASEQAELISSRLRELLSSGQGYIRAQFGVELGLRPELYPSWAVLSAAVAGLLGLLLLSWAAVCGGGRKRSSSAATDSGGGGEPLRAPGTKVFKPEELKKKNKKKYVKKPQSNGHTVPEPQEEVRACEEIPKPSSPPAPEIKNEKVTVKKNKKKPKTEVRSAQSVSAADGKQPDDGAWETKVSNREKRQLRRKDKGPDGSGSPGGAETPSYQGNPPAVSAPIPARKTRASYVEPLHARTAGKGEAVIAPVSSSWREEPSVNGGGWANVSMKLPTQMSTLEGDKWPAMPTAPRHRNPEPQNWGPETEGTWSGTDGRIKTEINSVTFSLLGMNTTAVEPRSRPPADLPTPPVEDDVWSGFNGISVADPSSDWNAPAELWGNYEEPPVVEAPDPPPQEPPTAHTDKVSDDEKEDASGGGAAKSKKKKKKKKKKTEDEGPPGQATPESSVPPVVNALPKAQPREEHPPVVTSSKQSTTTPSSEKKSDQTSEAPKPAQKKKVRRET